MNRKNRTTFSFIALTGLILYLAYTSFANSTSFYYEVSELTAQADNLYEEKVNVNGTIVPGSIHWDPDNILLTFKLTDNISTIDVVYNDVMPNNLRDDIPVTVSGIYYENNTLVAHSILTKCPSKYGTEITDETANNR